MSTQVANWFVNYRGRQWQPLMLELAAEIEAEDAAAEEGAAAVGFGAGSPRQVAAASTPARWPAPPVSARCSRKRVRDPAEDHSEAVEGRGGVHDPLEALPSPEVRRTIHRSPLASGEHCQTAVSCKGILPLQGF